jgi:tetratricopeptide (TPR) repeat protein
MNMAAARRNRAPLVLLLLSTACASAEDRFNEGLRLQSQGRYVEAVYRYAEAVEKDSELVVAQDRLLAAGDTAVMVALQEAAELADRGDPVGASDRYVRVDQMAARIREVGLRPLLPTDYAELRRAMFDDAIGWQMTEGDAASADGRWEDAVRSYRGARDGYLPSRDQVDASYDAETEVLLRWAQIELDDGHPRSAHDLAQRALGVRPSAARETVLAARDIQDRALAAGTVVMAVVPVTAEPGVREWLGGEFEIQLDDGLAVEYWTRPPLFVEVADPLILRRELRGLLRGRAAQSPLVVGRALDLIGADVGVMVTLSGIEVSEVDVRRDRHEAVVSQNARRGSREAVTDSVVYETVRGTMRYFIEAEIVLVDPDGLQVGRAVASARESGPFERGEFEGDPRTLLLEGDQARFFDPAVLGDQIAQIESALMSGLAASIASATYDQIVSAIR